MYDVMLYEVYSVVRERKQAELEATRREVVVMNAEPHAPIRIKTKAHKNRQKYIYIYQVYSYMSGRKRGDGCDYRGLSVHKAVAIKTSYDWTWKV